MHALAVTGAFARHCLVVAMLVSLFATLTPAPRAEAATVSQLRDRIERKVNNARSRHGLRPLRINVRYLQPNAQDHARAIAVLGQLVHDTAAALWREAPRRAEWRAENLASATRGPRAAKRIHRALMRSEGHRANILKRRATHMGVGVVKRGRRVWIVQRFADLR